MDGRQNAGYTIINVITVGESEIVLGVNNATPKMYVTWECSNNTNYYWGHYFDNELSAQKDFCRRALNKIKCLEILRNPKEPGR